MLGWYEWQKEQEEKRRQWNKGISIAGVVEESWMHLNLFDRKREYERMNKVQEYKYISRNRPELGLGVVYTKQNEIIGLVEHEMDLDGLESFEREDVEQFYDLDKFFEIPDSITNMSDFFKWAVNEGKNDDK